MSTIETERAPDGTFTDVHGAKRLPNGQFAKGSISLGGRPRGTRQQLADTFFEIANESAERHLADVFEEVRHNDPRMYLAVMSKVLPARYQEEAKKLRVFHVEMVGFGDVNLDDGSQSEDGVTIETDS